MTNDPIYSVEKKEGPIALWMLRDQRAGSEVVVAPSRGGMVSRFGTRNGEVLFFDEATFLDESKNVRGGNPVLFPTPGKLEGDAWAREGKRGTLKQHGFARNARWQVLAQGGDGAAWIRLGLDSSSSTLADYPWPFHAELRYALAAETLRIEITVSNTGSEPMPFGFGFHPYFAVPQSAKDSARIDTAATRAWDNVTKREITISGIDLTTNEVDLHLLDHGRADSALRWGTRSVQLRGSPEFTRWVVWTLKDKDFVCLEPWTCPGNALNTGQSLIVLPAGQTRSLWLEMAA
jgi:galactose mutarotase-like enzyme